MALITWNAEQHETKVAFGIATSPLIFTPS